MPGQAAPAAVTPPQLCCWQVCPCPSCWLDWGALAALQATRKEGAAHGIDVHALSGRQGGACNPCRPHSRMCGHSNPHGIETHLLRQPLAASCSGSEKGEGQPSRNSAPRAGAVPWRVLLPVEPMGMNRTSLSRWCSHDTLSGSPVRVHSAALRSKHVLLQECESAGPRVCNAAHEFARHLQRQPVNACQGRTPQGLSTHPLAGQPSRRRAGSPCICAARRHPWPGHSLGWPSPGAGAVTGCSCRRCRPMGVQPLRLAQVADEARIAQAPTIIPYESFSASSWLIVAQIAPHAAGRALTHALLDRTTV